MQALREDVPALFVPGGSDLVVGWQSALDRAVSGTIRRQLMASRPQLSSPSTPSIGRPHSVGVGAILDCPKERLPDVYN
jgi:hypothetical protein